MNTILSVPHMGGYHGDQKQRQDWHAYLEGLGCFMKYGPIRNTKKYVCISDPILVRQPPRPLHWARPTILFPRELAMKILFLGEMP